jgi:hypothetical protein
MLRNDESRHGKPQVENRKLSIRKSRSPEADTLIPISSAFSASGLRISAGNSRISSGFHLQPAKADMLHDQTLSERMDPDFLDDDRQASRGLLILLEATCPF